MIIPGRVLVMYFLICQRLSFLFFKLWSILIEISLCILFITVAVLQSIWSLQIQCFHLFGGSLDSIG